MARQLTTEGTVNLNPSACGDGSVVYQTFTDDRTAIWRMDADGSNPRIIVGDGNPVSPECSPDSTWIAYVHRRSDQQLAAVRAPIGGGAPTELIANLSRDNVHISPDGSLVQSIVWDMASNGTSVQVAPATGGPVRYTVEDSCSSQRSCLVAGREIASVSVVPWRRGQHLGTTADRRTATAGDVLQRSTDRTLRMVA